MDKYKGIIQKWHSYWGLILYLTIPYLMFIVPALIFMGIAKLLFWNFFNLTYYHLLSLTIPWLIWFGLSAIVSKDKSLSNLFGEPVYLGLIIGILLYIDGVLSFFELSWLENRPYLILLTSSIAAPSLWYFVPSLPE